MAPDYIQFYNVGFMPEGLKMEDLKVQVPGLMFLFTLSRFEKKRY